MANVSTYDMEIDKLVKSVKKHRVGVGDVMRICVCGNVYHFKDDGTNTWDLCQSCKRNERIKVA